jgi:endo-1,4-beta-xylanase
MLRRSLIILIATKLAAATGPYDMQASMVLLWPHGAPGSEGKAAPERWIEGGAPDAFHRITDVHNPALFVYLPPKAIATGAACIIAPGGGHKYLVMDLEGRFVAEKLNRMGVAGFVLKSRLAKAEGSTYRIEKESLADVQRAIRLVRSRAGEWNLNPDRICVMGFSAGGQLAALAENRFENGNPAASDPIERASSRPDFAVLGYPGIQGWNEPIAKNAPPTFLFVNNDDALSTAAAEYDLALKKAGISSEFHQFRRGGHGVGMTGRTAEFQSVPESLWPSLVEAWMKDLGFLAK